MTKNGLKPWVGECLGCFGMWTDSAPAEHLTVQENKHGALVIAASRPWTSFFFLNKASPEVLVCGQVEQEHPINEYDI